MNNVENVRSQIQQKKGYNPYFADINTGSLVLTDFDSFSSQLLMDKTNLQCPFCKSENVTIKIHFFLLFKQYCVIVVLSTFKVKYKKTK